MASWSDGGQIFPHISVAKACGSPCRVAYIEIINVMVATRMQNLTTMKQLVVIDQQIGVSLTISPSAVVHLEKKGT